jgi:hypothetical protein
MWKDDLRHGKGKVSSGNGDCFEAEFERDEVVGEVSSKMG